MSTNTTMSEPKDLRREHQVVSQEDWIVARKELLEAEKALTRRSDELARWRRELPWVRIDKEYRFETDQGTAHLGDLFKGRSQLLVYHFMFGHEYAAGCPSCSAIADGFDGFVIHLANHDVTLCAVSRAPLAKLQAYQRRMRWSFSWASSFDSDFNYDFQAAHTKEQEESGIVEYNFRETVRGGGSQSEMLDLRPSAEVEEENRWRTKIAASVGADWATYRRESPGLSAFVLEDDIVYHTYSAYARGLDGLWGMYQWLDRAPHGRNETGIWFRRHDEYDPLSESAGSCCHAAEAQP